MRLSWTLIIFSFVSSVRAEDAVKVTPTHGDPAPVLEAAKSVEPWSSSESFGRSRAEMLRAIDDLLPEKSAAVQKSPSNDSEAAKDK